MEWLAIGIALLITTPYLAYWYRADRTHPLLNRPEKRTYMFEDANGDRYNPFHHESEQSDTDDDSGYKYPAEAFD